MPGRAYNPKGYEPNLHGELQQPPKEVSEAYNKYQPIQMHQWHDKKSTYDEAIEYLKRGQGDVLGHYVYEMMYDIYAGIEDDILDGCIDTHLHIYPDYVPRYVDVIELAIEASKAGYRAIVTKDHFFNNVGQCWAAQWVVEDLVKRGELEHSCQVRGTNVLAWSYHPDQINLIRKYPNIGGVFFPTFTGNGSPGPVLPILDDKGKLMPDVKECIKRMADYKICVFTGHRSYEENRAMAEWSSECGGHILLTHAGGGHFGPGYSSCGTVQQAKELVKMPGVFIEISVHWFVGAAAIWPIAIPTNLTNWLKEMEKPDGLVMSTDLGQPSVIHPIDGYRVSIRNLIHAGFSKDYLKAIYQTNAAKAIYLDE